MLGFQPSGNNWSFSDCLFVFNTQCFNCSVLNAEHIVSILASLVKNCNGLQRQRLLQKFIENDHEKVDRLMELHFKYLGRVNKVDDKIELKKRVSIRLVLARSYH